MISKHKKRKRPARTKAEDGFGTSIPPKSGPAVDPEIARHAVTTLQTRRAEYSKIAKNPEEQLGLVVSEAKVSSRKEHIKAFAVAYEIYAASKSDEKIKFYLDALLNKNGAKEELRGILEAVVSYGDGTEEDKTNARRLYSRDVGALRHLIDRGIRPDGVVDLAKQPGEGLDAWHRKAAASRRPNGVTKKATSSSGLPRGIAPGCLVLVRYDEQGGWWEAVVEGVEKSHAMVRWRYPQSPKEKKPYKAASADLILMPASFQKSGK